MSERDRYSVSQLVNDLRKWRFWRHFLTNAFAATGAMVLVLEVVNYVAGRIPVSGWLLAAVIATVSIGYGAERSWPRPIRQRYSAPNTEIEIVQGDLLGQDCHLVVGTCDTFDTALPYIIASSSLQGQMLNRLYGGDVDRLDREIAEALTGRSPVATVQKPGKTSRYKIGTIATLRRGAHRLYLLAYTEMSETSTVQGSPDGIWQSLLCLWEEISRTANGGTVAVPVIGGGLARVSQLMTAQDSIRLIVMSFMFASRAGRVCDRLRIVVADDAYDRLDRLELQAFLSSLLPS